VPCADIISGVVNSIRALDQVKSLIKDLLGVMQGGIRVTRNRAMRSSTVEARNRGQ
jgi:hypothetical protein